MSQQPDPGAPDSRSFGEAAGDLIQEVEEGIQPPANDGVRDERSPLILPGVLALIFAGVVVWNLSLLSTSSPPLSDAEARRADGVLVFVATQAVQNFEATNGRLPVSLAEAGVEAPGLRFTPQGGGFTIVSEGSEAPIRYDGAKPLDDFLLRLGIFPPDVDDPGAVR